MDGQTLVPRGLFEPSYGFCGVGEFFGQLHASSCIAFLRVVMPQQSPVPEALLLREVCVRFGHAEEAIPYTTGTGDGKVVDIAGITAIS